MAKRGEINKLLGMTDGKFKSKVKSSLRKIWTQTSRKVYVNSVRFKHFYPKTGNNVWHVKCANCGKIMRETDKAKRVKIDGTLEKKAKSLFEVNHIHGITPMTDNVRDTLGPHFDDLIYGDCEILCVDCHKAETKRQGAK